MSEFKNPIPADKIPLSPPERDIQISEYLFFCIFA